MKSFTEFMSESKRTLQRAIGLGDRLAQRSKEEWEKQPPSYMRHKAMQNPAHKLVGASGIDYAGMEAYKIKAERGHDVFDPSTKKPNISKIAIKDLVPSQEFTSWDREKAKEKFKDNAPIRVLFHKNKHYVIDGHHRIVAARLKGEKHIDANIQSL
jgi:hypothetical protein